jgi:hypothetical protein
VEAVYYTAKERPAVRSTIYTIIRITTCRRTAIAKRHIISTKSRAILSSSVLIKRRRKKKTTIITLVYNGDDNNLKGGEYIGIPNFQGIYKSDQLED